MSYWEETTKPAYYDEWDVYHPAQRGYIDGHGKFQAHDAPEMRPTGPWGMEEEYRPPKNTPIYNARGDYILGKSTDVGYLDEWGGFHSTEKKQGYYDEWGGFNETNPTPKDDWDSSW